MDYKGRGLSSISGYILRREGFRALGRRPSMQVRLYRGTTREASRRRKKVGRGGRRALRPAPAPEGEEIALLSLPPRRLSAPWRSSLGVQRSAGVSGVSRPPRLSCHPWISRTVPGVDRIWLSFVFSGLPATGELRAYGGTDACPLRMTGVEPGGDYAPSQLSLVTISISEISVRWTGQRSAISSRRCRCSSVRVPRTSISRSMRSIFPTLVSHWMQSRAWIFE